MAAYCVRGMIDALQGGHMGGGEPFACYDDRDKCGASSGGGVPHMVWAVAEKGGVHVRRHTARQPRQLSRQSCCKPVLGAWDKVGTEITSCPLEYKDSFFGPGSTFSWPLECAAAVVAVGVKHWC